jgi:5-hydroxyisourate hydrolase
MGALTTHVLDTSSGKPGDGISIELFSTDGERRLLTTAMTNQDGRCDQPLLQDDAFAVGEYELVFQAGEYFSRQGVELTDPPFLNRVVIRFGVSDASQHYHVPLLISPHGYSTYRGS